MHENNYYFSGPVTADRALEAAAEILASRSSKPTDSFCNPTVTKSFDACKLQAYERKVFAVMLLDNQHRLIEFKELFFGTIDAAVIFAHNQPSGDPEPSQADRRITTRLIDALGLIDVRVLDHTVVGDTCVSFAERRLL